MRINECYLSESRARKAQSEKRTQNRTDWILVSVAAVLYFVVSNMSYNDCLIRGIC